LALLNLVVNARDTPCVGDKLAILTRPADPGLPQPLSSHADTTIRGLIDRYRRIVTDGLCGGERWIGILGPSLAKGIGTSNSTDCPAFLSAGASSWLQISNRLASGRACAISLRRAAPLFKRLLGLLAALPMARPGLPVRTGRATTTVATPLRPDITATAHLRTSAPVSAREATPRRLGYTAACRGRAALGPALTAISANHLRLARPKTAE